MGASEPGGRIVAACDFTVTAEATVDLAAVVARQLELPLLLLHVRPADPDAGLPQAPEVYGREMSGRAEFDLGQQLRAGDRAHIRARRADAERRLFALAPEGATPVLDDGDPFERVRARLGPVDLLVVGTGRLASRLARAVEVPVLVVPQGSRAHHDSVLVGMDFSPAAEAALRFSERLARAGVARSMGHVARRASQADARARLESRAAGAWIDFQLATGAPADGLLALAHRAGADALVLGMKRRPTLVEALVGSATRDLLRRARLPLWLVPLPGS